MLTYAYTYSYCHVCLCVCLYVPVRMLCASADESISLSLSLSFGRSSYLSERACARWCVENQENEGEQCMQRFRTLIMATN